MERATFMEAWRTKTRQGVFVTVTAAPGNAASRIENFVISTAPYATGGYPDIDELFRQQAHERDRKKREALLHQIQHLMYERVMYGGSSSRPPARDRPAGRRAGGRPQPAALFHVALGRHAPEEALTFRHRWRCVMNIQLDHIIVPSRRRRESAKLLADLWPCRGRRAGESSRRST